MQICSTLKWISLFYLSLGLTGKWIILTGPVWSLFSPSPWFWVFLEQGGGVSHCWHFAALMLTQGLPSAWPPLADVQGCGGSVFSVVTGREVESYQCCSTRLRLPSACCPVTASACQHIHTRCLHLWHWDAMMLQSCWYYTTAQIDFMCIMVSESPPYPIYMLVYSTIYLCLLENICFRHEKSCGNSVLCESVEIWAVCIFRLHTQLSILDWGEVELYKHIQYLPFKTLIHAA